MNEYPNAIKDTLPSLIDEMSASPALKASSYWGEVSPYRLPVTMGSPPCCFSIHNWHIVHQFKKGTLPFMMQPVGKEPTS